MRKALPLHKRSGYAAASASPRWPASASMPAPASQTHADAFWTGSRATHVVANDPLASSLIRAWCDSILPDQPAVQLTPRNRGNEQEAQLFYASILATLRLMVSTERRTGEAFARMRATRDGRLIIDVLNSEQCDRSKNADLENGGRIVQGIQENANGDIVGRWFFEDTPDQAFSILRPSRFVPAEDVIHYFEQKYPGQRRGISAFAPVLPRLHEHSKLIDALGARANTSALFGGFITDASGTGFGDAEVKAPEADLTMEPGGLRVLPVGTDIRFPTMPDAGDAINLLKAMEREICAGVGIPYELATGDLSGTNYSSGKLGLEAFKRSVKAHRATLLIPTVLEPIYRRWSLLRLLTGQSASNGSISFLFPEFASLDPKKEAEADVIMINAGIKSRAQVVAEKGRDIADVDAEIAADTFVPRATPQAGQDQENENV